MDCLAPGDVVILTTPPAFRWVHFSYAISKGIHVFMEKPVTVDGPTTRKMLALSCEHEFAPDVDKITEDSPAPLVADADGKYPVPEPGVTTKREY